MAQSAQPINLTSGWSHDIRTHLHILKGAIGMMQSGNLTQDQTKEYTEMIRQNISAMEKLLNHLLNEEQMSSVMCANLESVPINDLLLEVIENVTPLAASRQVDLVYDIESSLYAFCDPEMLERVLYNLMTNAMKYTDAKGLVYLCARMRGEDACITISDTGCGLTDEQLEQLFGGTEQAVSQGYGLKLVKAMMASMNGQLECKSQRCIGTTFYLYLPKKEQRSVQGDFI